MSKLFQSITIKSVTLKNRLVVSPMCQYSSQDGFANDWHLVHLGSRAVGGAGLIVTEACAVAPEGRISLFDLGIWKDEQIEGLKRVTGFIQAQGSVAGIQLAHAGRKASCAEPWNGGQQIPIEKGGWQVLGPSTIPFKAGTQIPISISKEEIKRITTDFGKAAKRSLEAGFQIIELHAAHGYLLHEFLSPISNSRTDEYGGSFENRIRLLLEVVNQVQAEWPADRPLFVRISASDWVAGGWNVEESVALSKILLKMGVDLIDCSSGGNVEHAKIPVAPGYQVPFAKQIKHETGILTGTVGLITDAEQAEKILQNEEADLIFMAREFLRDPYFPLHASTKLSEAFAWPVQYQRAK